MTYQTERMGQIVNFENIDAWQQARELVAEVYKFTDKDTFRSDPALKDQMRRMVISVLTNIATGFEKEKNSEFVKFLSLTKALLSELRTCLYVSLDVGYISNSDFDYLFEKIFKTNKLVLNLIEYLNEQRRKDFNDRRKTFRKQA
ncbi:MAG: four helix bundle protein [Spirochaetes bacterium]|nr:four helix bundle protein [Spirochaetota bacterium]